MTPTDVHTAVETASNAADVDGLFSHASRG
jgi:hypothetical protein